MRSSAAVPVALTIAGSDSSAGAGIQADLKTFGALGVYGITAITCVVAETPGKVARIEPVSVDLVAAQLEVLLGNFRVGALKTGLLCSAEIIDRIASVLNSRANRQIPLVIDPVMIATTGARLLQDDALARYESVLFPRAALITPNMDEAAALLGQPIHRVDEMRRAAEKLAARYGVAFLVKGGHLAGSDAVDVLCSDDEVMEFSTPFSRGIATHGTGCTYSAAIAAGLAKGLPLREAVAAAKDFVAAAVSQHFAWDHAENVPIHALNHFALEK